MNAYPQTAEPDPAITNMAFRSISGLHELTTQSAGQVLAAAVKHEPQSGQVPAKMTQTAQMLKILVN